MLFCAFRTAMSIYFYNLAISVSRVDLDFDFKIAALDFEFDDIRVITVFQVFAVVVEVRVHVFGFEVVFACHVDVREVVGIIDKLERFCLSDIDASGF